MSRGGFQSISAARRAQLNAGACATTLSECLAVDFAALIGHVFPEIGSEVVSQLQDSAALGISKRMPLAARLIMEHLGSAALERLAVHPSDTARGWACFVIGQTEGMTLSQRLAKIRVYADDLHFGVREWAWMAVRPHLAADLSAAIALLAADWASDPSERVRRFASEALRPRGVWCSHITALRQNPAVGLPLIEPLRADPSRYVQDSVGNWLNDVSKDHPDWVCALCERWLRESKGKETAYICRRAQRTIK